MLRPLVSAALVALVTSTLTAAPAVTTPATAEPPRERTRFSLPESSPGAGRIDTSFGPAQRAAAIDRARRQAQQSARELGLSSRERLVVTDVVRDADGRTHTRYDRRYAGLDVVGGDLVVHRDAAGQIVGTDFATDADLSQVPSVRARVPLAAAAASARRVSGLGSVARQERPSRVVYAVGDTPRLVWETVVAGHTDEGPQRNVVYTDARNGRLVNRWSMTHRAEGPGRTLYAGTVRLKTVKPSVRFRLRDNTRGGTRTFDARNRKLGLSNMGSIFTDADNRWGNGTMRSRQSAAADAHYGAAKTWDYFRSRFNRRGVRNNGAGARIRVHYGKIGSPVAGNAFWDDRCFCVTLGSGNRYFRPLVALDVVGHEIAHGVTSRTAGLLYFGESGGLNEATSDIFGTMVEFSARNRRDPGDYYIGEKVWKGRRGFLRRMDRPATDGASFNCWSPRMGRSDVHYTSGPANHFFYLLAEGTRVRWYGGRKHSSPTCNGTKIGGVGRAKAARIWYRALNVYMTSTTGYHDARDATIRAARDIYGRNSTPCKVVTRAWNAVSVNAQNEGCGGPLPSITAKNQVGNPGFEAGGNGVWTAPAGAIMRNPDYGFAHSGRWWAYLSGYGGPTVDELSQQIAIPEATRVALRFHLAVLTEEPSSAGARDVLRVWVDHEGGSARVATYSNRHGSNTYTQRDLDLSRFAGQTVTLRFVGQENANDRATAFWLDDVSVRAR